MFDHLLSPLVNKASISEEVCEWSCAFMWHNIILQHKFLDNRPMFFFRMGFSSICNMHKLLATAFLFSVTCCQNVCNYSSITHVETCTERYFTWEKNLFLLCMGPRRKVPAKMYTSISKQVCTDLHQLSLSTIFFNVLPVTTLLKARGEPGKETMLLYNYSPFLIQQLNMADTKETFWFQRKPQSCCFPLNHVWICFLFLIANYYSRFALPSW